MSYRMSDQSLATLQHLLLLCKLNILGCCLAFILLAIGAMATIPLALIHASWMIEYRINPALFTPAEQQSMLNALVISGLLAATTSLGTLMLFRYLRKHLPGTLAEVQRLQRLIDQL